MLKRYYLTSMCLFVFPCFLSYIYMNHIVHMWIDIIMLPHIYAFYVWTIRGSYMINMCDRYSPYIFHISLSEELTVRSLSMNPMTSVQRRWKLVYILVFIFHVEDMSSGKNNIKFRISRKLFNRFASNVHHNGSQNV